MRNSPLAQTLPLSLLALAITLNCSSPIAHAQILATEDFESYPHGSQLTGQNGGSGFNDAWSVNAAREDDVTIVDASLSYSNGSVVSDGGSRALEFAFDPAEGSEVTDGIILRALETALTETVYMSLLFRDTVNADFATDFVQWGFSDGTTNPQASIIRRNGTLQARSTTAPNNSADSGIASEVGLTRMLVLKAEKTTGGNYDRISLFFDPDSELEPAAPAAVASVDSGLASFPNFLARSAFHGQGDTFQIDNIVIGSTWEDAVLSTAQAPFAITEIVYTPADEMAGPMVTLTWNSRPGQNFVLVSSVDLTNWILEIEDGVSDPGDTTTRTFDLSLLGLETAELLFFRVENQ
jgi:hypothetical protein